MVYLLATLTLGAAVILQSTIVVRVQLLQGAADLVLITLLGWVLHETVEGHWQWGVIAGILVGYISELPFWLTIGAYLSVIAMVRFIQAFVWQVPLLILFTTTFFGSLFIQFLSFFYLWVLGTPFQLGEVFNLVILPSLVLNMLVVLPVYGLLGELVKQFYPPEVEA